MLGAVEHPITAIAPGTGLHAPDVRARPRFRHGERIHPLTPHGRQQVAFDLLALTRHQDILGPAEKVVQRHRAAPQFPLHQGKFQVVQPRPAHAFGEIAGIKAQFNGLAPDLVGHFAWHFAGALHQILMRIDLVLDETAHRGRDHFLFLGQSVLHGLTRMVAASQGAKAGRSGQWSRLAWLCKSFMVASSPFSALTHAESDRASSKATCCATSFPLLSGLALPAKI